MSALVEGKGARVAARGVVDGSMNYGSGREETEDAQTRQPGMRGRIRGPSSDKNICFFGRNIL